MKSNKNNKVDIDSLIQINLNQPAIVNKQKQPQKQQQIPVEMYY